MQVIEGVISRLSIYRGIFATLAGGPDVLIAWSFAVSGPWDYKTGDIRLTRSTWGVKRCHFIIGR
jgi:hypothetical protein